MNESATGKRKNLTGQKLKVQRQKLPGEVVGDTSRAKEN
jgi:hypothetical protein